MNDLPTGDAMETARVWPVEILTTLAGTITQHLDQHPGHYITVSYDPCMDAYNCLCVGSDTDETCKDTWRVCA